MAGNDPTEVCDRMTFYRVALLRNLLFVLLFICLASGCDKLVADSPRVAWERAMKAYAERDYGALWDSLSDHSRQDTIRVLAHVKREPKYRESMRIKFQIAAETLDTMPPREFFIALMTGVERAAPKMIELRAKNATTAEFTKMEIHGSKALVSWRSGLGEDETMAFILEGDRWKPIIKR